MVDGANISIYSYISILFINIHRFYVDGFSFHAHALQVVHHDRAHAIHDSVCLCKFQIRNSYVERFRYGMSPKLGFIIFRKKVFGALGGATNQKMGPCVGYLIIIFIKL